MSQIGKKHSPSFKAKVAIARRAATKNLTLAPGLLRFARDGSLH